MKKEKVFYVSGETATGDREAIRGIVETQTKLDYCSEYGYVLNGYKYT